MTGNIGAVMLLTEEQAAAYIGLSVWYLRQDRKRGLVGNRTPGPRWMKLGRMVRYHRADLDAWLESRKAPSHQERQAAQQQRLANPRGRA